MFVKKIYFEETQFDNNIFARCLQISHQIQPFFTTFTPFARQIFTHLYKYFYSITRARIYHLTIIYFLLNLNKTNSIQWCVTENLLSFKHQFFIYQNKTYYKLSRQQKVSAWHSNLVLNSIKITAKNLKY